MAYADYTFYLSRGGQMSASDFNKYATNASDYIDYITSDNAKSYSDTEDRLKKCCCVLADEMKVNEKREGISSESIGSYSVSFADSNTIAIQKKYASICCTFIGSTGLMYRGL